MYRVVVVTGCLSTVDGVTVLVVLGTEVEVVDVATAECVDDWLKKKPAVAIPTLKIPAHPRSVHCEPVSRPELFVNRHLRTNEVHLQNTQTRKSYRTLVKVFEYLSTAHSRRDERSHRDSPRSVAVVSVLEYSGQQPSVEATPDGVVAAAAELGGFSNGNGDYVGRTILAVVGLGMYRNLRRGLSHRRSFCWGEGETQPWEFVSAA